MATYSKWNQIDMYRFGSIDTSNEIIPQHTIFAIIPNEEREFEIQEEPFKFNDTLKNIEIGNITSLDKNVLCLVALSTYATPKQILELLILIGDTTANENTLKSSLKRLHKNDLILVSKVIFQDVETNQKRNSISKIISLNKNGSEIAKRLEVSHNWSNFERVDSCEKLKTILCGNQLRNTYLKSGLPIEWFKLREKVSIKEVSPKPREVALRPSFTVSIDGVVLLFEVCRRKKLWVDWFIDKIQRYDIIFSNPENSWNITDDFYIIINGEDAQHNVEINSILKDLDLSLRHRILFTEDLLQFGKNFDNSIYSLDDDDNIIDYWSFD
ncbi:MAG: hypothetical protein ACI4WH_00260 [Oscillospiraceae bacterium]